MAEGKEPKPYSNSIRYSQTFKDIVDKAKGEGLSNKLESIVLEFYRTVPTREKRVKELDKEIEKREARLKKINDEIAIAEKNRESWESFYYHLEWANKAINKNKK